MGGEGVEGREGRVYPPPLQCPTPFLNVQRLQKNMFIIVAGFTVDIILARVPFKGVAQERLISVEKTKEC